MPLIPSGSPTGSKSIGTYEGTERGHSNFASFETYVNETLMPHLEKMGYQPTIEENTRTGFNRWNPQTNNYESMVMPTVGIRRGEEEYRVGYEPETGVMFLQNRRNKSSVYAVPHFHEGEGRIKHAGDYLLDILGNQEGSIYDSIVRNQLAHTSVHAYQDATFGQTRSIGRFDEAPSTGYIKLQGEYAGERASEAQAILNLNKHLEIFAKSGSGTTYNNPFQEGSTLTKAKRAQQLAVSGKRRDWYDAVGIAKQETTTPFQYEWELEPEHGYRQRGTYFQSGLITPEGQSYGREAYVGSDFTRTVNDISGLKVGQVFGQGNIKTAEGLEHAGDVRGLQRIFGTQITGDAVHITGINQETNEVSYTSYSMKNFDVKFGGSGKSHRAARTDGYFRRIGEEDADFVMAMPTGKDFGRAALAAYSAAFGSSDDLHKDLAQRSEAGQINYNPLSFWKAEGIVSNEGISTLQQAATHYARENTKLTNVQWTGARQRFQQEIMGEMIHAHGEKLGGDYDAARAMFQKRYMQGGTEDEQFQKIWEAYNLDKGSYDTAKFVRDLEGNVTNQRRYENVQFDGLMVNASINTYAMRADVIQRPSAVGNRPTQNIRPEMLSWMEQYNPDRYNAIQNQIDAGLFRTHQRGILEAVRSAETGVGGTLFEGDIFQSIYSETEAKNPGMSVGDLQIETLRAYEDEMGGGTQKISIQGKDYYLPGAGDIASMLTVNDEDEIISGPGKKLMQAMFAAAQAQTADPFTRSQFEETALASISGAYTGMQRYMEESSDFMAGALGGVSEKIGGAAIGASEVEPGLALIPMNRLKQLFPGESIDDLRKMMSDTGHDGRVMRIMGIRDPEADPSMTLNPLKMGILEDYEQIHQLYFGDIGNNVLINPVTIQQWTGDMDADTARYFTNWRKANGKWVGGNVDVGSTQKDFAEAAFSAAWGAAGSEAWKQMENSRDKADLSKVFEESFNLKYQSGRELSEGSVKNELIAKGEIGQKYALFHRQATLASASIARQTVGGEAATYIGRMMGPLAAEQYQGLLDLNIDEDPSSFAISKLIGDTFMSPNGSYSMRDGDQFKTVAPTTREMSAKLIATFATQKLSEEETQFQGTIGKSIAAGITPMSQIDAAFKSGGQDAVDALNKEYYDKVVTPIRQKYRDDLAINPNATPSMPDDVRDIYKGLSNYQDVSQFLTGNGTMESMSPLGIGASATMANNKSKGRAPLGPVQRDISERVAGINAATRIYTGSEIGSTESFPEINSNVIRKFKSIYGDQGYGSFGQIASDLGSQVSDMAISGIGGVPVLRGSRVDPNRPIESQLLNELRPSMLGSHMPQDIHYALQTSTSPTDRPEVLARLMASGHVGLDQVDPFGRTYDEHKELLGNLEQNPSYSNWAAMHFGDKGRGIGAVGGRTALTFLQQTEIPELKQFYEQNRQAIDSSLKGGSAVNRAIAIGEQSEQWISKNVEEFKNAEYQPKVESAFETVSGGSADFLVDVDGVGKMVVDVKTYGESSLQKNIYGSELSPTIAAQQGVYVEGLQDKGASNELFGISAIPSAPLKGGVNDQSMAEAMQLGWEKAGQHHMVQPQGDKKRAAFEAYRSAMQTKHGDEYTRKAAPITFFDAQEAVKKTEELAAQNIDVANRGGQALTVVSGRQNAEQQASAIRGLASGGSFNPVAVTPFKNTDETLGAGEGGSDGGGGGGVSVAPETPDSSRRSSGGSGGQVAGFDYDRLESILKKGQGFGPWTSGNYKQLGDFVQGMNEMRDTGQITPRTARQVMKGSEVLAKFNAGAAGLDREAAYNVIFGAKDEDEGRLIQSQYMNDFRANFEEILRAFGEGSEVTLNEKQLGGARLLADGGRMAKMVKHSLPIEGRLMDKAQAVGGKILSDIYANKEKYLAAENLTDEEKVAIEQNLATFEPWMETISNDYKDAEAARSIAPHAGESSVDRGMRSVMSRTKGMKSIQQLEEGFPEFETVRKNLAQYSEAIASATEGQKDFNNLTKRGTKTIGEFVDKLDDFKKTVDLGMQYGRLVKEAGQLGMEVDSYVEKADSARKAVYKKARSLGLDEQVDEKGEFTEGGVLDKMKKSLDGIDESILSGIRDQRDQQRMKIAERENEREMQRTGVGLNRFQRPFQNMMNAAEDGGYHNMTRVMYTMLAGGAMLGNIIRPRSEEADFYESRMFAKARFSGEMPSDYEEVAERRIRRTEMMERRGEAYSNIRDKYNEAFINPLYKALGADNMAGVQVAGSAAMTGLTGWWMMSHGSGLEKHISPGAVLGGIGKYATSSWGAAGLTVAGTIGAGLLVDDLVQSNENSVLAQFTQSLYGSLGGKKDLYNKDIGFVERGWQYTRNIAGTVAVAGMALTNIAGITNFSKDDAGKFYVSDEELQKDKEDDYLASFSEADRATYDAAAKFTPDSADPINEFKQRMTQLEQVYGVGKGLLTEFAGIEGDPFARILEADLLRPELSAQLDSQTANFGAMFGWSPEQRFNYAHNSRYYIPDPSGGTRSWSAGGHVTYQEHVGRSTGVLSGLANIGVSISDSDLGDYVMRFGGQGPQAVAARGPATTATQTIAQGQSVGLFADAEDDELLGMVNAAAEDSSFLLGMQRSVAWGQNLQELGFEKPNTSKLGEGALLYGFEEMGKKWFERDNRAASAIQRLSALGAIGDKNQALRDYEYYDDDEAGVEKYVSELESGASIGERLLSYGITAGSGLSLHGQSGEYYRRTAITAGEFIQTAYQQGAITESQLQTSYDAAVQNYGTSAMGVHQIGLMTRAASGDQYAMSQTWRFDTRGSGMLASDGSWMGGRNTYQNRDLRYRDTLGEGGFRSAEDSFGIAGYTLGETYMPFSRQFNGGAGMENFAYSWQDVSAAKSPEQMQADYLRYGQFGLRGIRDEGMRISAAGSAASAGISMQNLRAGFVMQTGQAWKGGPTLDQLVGGDVSAVGARNNAGVQGLIAEHQGKLAEAGGAISNWEFQDWQVGMKRRKFDFQNQMFWEQNSMERGQFNEKWQTQYNRASTNFAWQEEDRAISKVRTGISRQWQDEDISFNRSKSYLQFGWQMEDFDESLRFAKGRDRLKLLRQRDRATTTFSMDMSHQDVEVDRMKTSRGWEDDDFDKEKARAAERRKWELDDFAKEKKYFEEGMALKEKQHNQEVAWFNEEEGMEKRLQETQRLHYIWQTEQQDKQIGIQASIAAAQLKLAEEQKKITDLMSDTQKETEDSVKNLGIMNDVMAELVEKFGKVMAIVGNVTDPEAAEPAPKSEPGGLRAYGGEVSKGETVVVGEHGPEVFKPKSDGKIVPNAKTYGVTERHAAPAREKSGTSDESTELKHIRLILQHIYDKLSEREKPSPSEPAKQTAYDKYYSRLQ